MKKGLNFLGIMVLVLKIYWIPSISSSHEPSIQYTGTVNTC